MPAPVRSLPVLQNWDCHACGGCCKEYEVNVTEEERQRILAQGWEGDPATAGKPLVVRAGRGRRARWRLGQDENGCVFLNEAGLCRIHAKFGAEAKPLACRVYPFVLVPVGGQWRVGLRFACPSVVENKGRPVEAHAADVRAYAAALERREPGAADLPPPPLGRGQAVSAAELAVFSQALRNLVRDRSDRLERRLRKCLALADLCRQAKFDKLSGGRLAEFLAVVSTGTDAEVPRSPADVPPPTWVGRVLFRQAAALFARKDQGPNRGLSRRGRLALLAAAVRFARGRGRVPPVNAHMGAVTFEQVDAAREALPGPAEQVLERYYLVKLESLQFCGPTNFRLAFWDGLASLVLTYPMVVWLSRTFPQLPRGEAVGLALRVVDDNFGFNPLFAQARQKLALRILAHRGELARLVAWYGREPG
jgi:lysine-N-methylase